MSNEEAITSSIAGSFNPKNVLEGRKRIIASIVQRRGQAEFRRRLLEIYGGQCAISACNATEALEAVHIIPYRGPQTNYPSNGLLLRADLHTLFDLGLLAIDTNTMTVVISPELNSTTYHEFTGRQLSLPKDENVRPSIEALDMHRLWAGL